MGVARDEIQSRDYNGQRTGVLMTPLRVCPQIRWLVLALLSACSSAALAHGYAGQRFFPATITVDDPFVADEADLTYGRIRAPNDEGMPADVRSHSTEIAYRLTPRLGVSVAGSYLRLQPEGEDAVHGWDNIEVGARYLAHVDAQKESLLSLGLNAELGGTGSDAIGASAKTAYMPAVYFGKGFGALPDSARYWRPFAITGVVGPRISMDAQEPNTLEWGLTLQYSIPYLEDFVWDTGLGPPWRNMVPVVELPMSTCLDHGCDGHTTTGTVNPGVIWFGRYGQIGLEAAVPVNQRSGSHVGVLLQFHLYLDDLFPRRF